MGEGGLDLKYRDLEPRQGEPTQTKSTNGAESAQLGCQALLGGMLWNIGPLLPRHRTSPGESLRDPAR